MLTHNTYYAPSKRFVTRKDFIDAIGSFTCFRSFDLLFRGRSKVIRFRVRPYSFRKSLEEANPIVVRFELLGRLYEFSSPNFRQFIFDLHWNSLLHCVYFPGGQKSLIAVCARQFCMSDQLGDLDSHTLMNIFRAYYPNFSISSNVEVLT